MAQLGSGRFLSVAAFFHGSRSPCRSTSAPNSGFCPIELAMQAQFNEFAVASATCDRRKGIVRIAVSTIDPTVNINEPIIPPWSST